MVDEARGILGRIMERLNSVSNALRIAKANPRMAVAEAQAALPDIANMPAMRQAIQDTISLIPNASGVPNAKIMAGRLANSIMQAQFSQPHIARLQEIASGQAPATGDVTEVDAGRLQNFLKSSIYSSANDSDKSLKAIREMLQNATDAALKRHVSEGGALPSIEVHTAPAGDGLMDMSVKDNGIGMDWNMMSQKFFRYFASGKEGETSSAGGFGIAKAVIQETPQHGWSIESNSGSPVSASRFDRNMFFATNGQHTPGAPEVSVDQKGTTMTLFGVPAVSDWRINDMSSAYAIGQVDIYINGVKVNPKFNIAELKPLDKSLSSVADVVSQNENEKDIAQGVVDRLVKGMPEELSGMHWEGAAGKKTSVSFSLQKSTYGGYLFVILNGQYQYEKYVGMDKANLVCFVTTTTRPHDDEYPMDPGRDNLRAPYAGEVDKAIAAIKDVLSKISRDSLFKDGLHIQWYNTDKEALTASPSSISSGELGDLSSIGSAKIKEIFESNASDEQKQQAATDAITQLVESSIGAVSGESSSVVLPGSSPDNPGPAEQKMKPTKGLTMVQKEMIKAAVEAIKGSSKDVHEEMKKIIDNVSTPCAIISQKGFAAQAGITEKPDMVKNLMMVWGSSLKRVLNQASRLPGARIGKKVVPAIVMSNECLALYVPPRGGDDRYMIAVNPLSVASIIDPDSLREDEENLGLKDDLSQHRESEQYFPEDVSLVDKVATFIHHSVVHEVTHLLYPDSGGGYHDQFHIHVSYLENACHFLYKDTRADVSQYMKGMKGDSKKLMKTIQLSMMKTDRPSTAITQEHEMRSIWDAKQKGQTFKQIEKEFNMRPNNGMNAYRVYKKYEDLLQSRQGPSTTASGWLSNVCKFGRK